MQTTKLNNAIRATFKTGDADDAAMADVLANVGRMSRDKFEALAQSLASDYYSVPLITKSTGRVVFDSTADKYETARKRVQRLIKAVYETAKAEDVEIPAELLRLAQALAKAANEYEGARSLASKALAAAFAK